ncbi:uncharacterized protein AB675_7503 [Cyphellophora attinorum]|uniref:Uncharacterized protein n=1 Tax=Cyphellophora attinorum TaxID=1664694 RepID=A0A0N1H4S6_9EURO|nr:uncharacterized protein AB675_7503 [Phialophora attinorum]KPI40384.1 hypothetical protein AB675_7503 [Phialophora attinorum]
MAKTRALSETASTGDAVNTASLIATNRSRRSERLRIKRVEKTKTDYLSRLPREILARIFAHTLPNTRHNKTIMVKPRQPGDKSYRGYPTFDWSLGPPDYYWVLWDGMRGGFLPHVKGFAALVLVSKFFRGLTTEYLDPRDSWIYFTGEYRSRREAMELWVERAGWRKGVDGLVRHEESKARYT